jgi:hypothetical protein
MPGTLVVGDVHGCASELDLLLRRVQPRRAILVGDLFTRGPDPRGVWDLIRRWDAEAVVGNHDLDVLERWTPGVELPKRAFRWLAQLPAVIEGDGWIVVHAAVHPDGPAATTRKIAAGKKAPPGPTPWNEHWRGDRLIIHGHESKRGLVDRRPYSLGLDTACHRGGMLTGYVIEDDRLVSVPSRHRQVA